MKPARWLLCSVGLATTLCGCGEDEAPSFDLSAGGLQVHAEQSQRLVIRASDGRVLLDGLPPGDVAAESPPLVGFAVRDITTSYEMQFGSFKPTEHPVGGWRVADELRQAGQAIQLLDEGGAALATLSFSSKADGHLAIDTAADASGVKRMSWGFACAPSDHFAGFGAQAFDVDHRGFTVPTFVAENGIGKAENDDYTGPWFAQGQRHSSHLPIPQYLSRRGYVLATYTPYQANFALCSESATTARIEIELGATIHIFDGPSPAEALERASAELGRPRMPPKVAFAPWLDATHGSEEVRRVANKLREEGVPSSVIWTEDWRGGNWDGDSYKLKEEWEVDRDLYPDFEDVADDLHDAGFHFHVYFNPFIYKGSKAWQETQPNGWLVQTEDGDDYVFGGAKFTDTGLLDLFHPDARAWAVEKMQDAIALGTEGWMNDFAEWLPTDSVTYAGSGADLHNEYPVEWQRIAREAIDGVDDGVDRLFFGRSGWFGTPALADVIWAGDQRTTFAVDDGMHTIIPIGVGLGLVGVSTYGHDIAGYQAATNPGSTKEVFFRWTSLGAWSPVMRTHHGNQPNLNWNWEKDDETIAHFRSYAQLHMSLVPWLEGLAKVASKTGLPMWRALAIHFPEDVAVWPINDQVMMGEHVLIAPVLEEGANKRDVYLPAGRWYPFDGGSALSGGASESIDASIDQIPVLVRQGAVIPTYPDGVLTLVNASAQVPGPDSVGDDRVLLVFTGASGSFTEADGKLSYSLEQLADDDGESSAKLVWNDKTLSDCDTMGDCQAGETAHVSGNGTLDVQVGGETKARLSIAGGKSDRKLTVVVRR